MILPESGYQYHSSTLFTTIQIADYFSNRAVIRLDENGDPDKVLPVRAVVADVETINYDLIQGNPPLYANKMPFIAIEPVTGSFQYDRSRERNMLGEKKYEYRDPSKDVLVKQPQPVIIDYRLHIYASVTDDIDQLLENIMFWFRPYVMVRVRTPELPDSDDNSIVNIKVDWDGKIHTEVNRGKDKVRFATSTFNLRAYSYNWNLSKNAGYLIQKIYSRFYEGVCSEDARELDASVITHSTTSGNVTGLDSVGDTKIFGDVLSGIDNVTSGMEHTFEPYPGYYIDEAGILRVSGGKTFSELGKYIT
jgi:hypothetical protein